MGEVKALSDDHKPTNDGKSFASLRDVLSTISISAEKERIYGAGGYVDCGRVNGEHCSGRSSLCAMLNLTYRQPRVISSNRRL